MKKTSFKLMLFLPMLALVFFASCDENMAEEAITEEETVDLLENSLSLETSGMAEQTETVAAIGQAAPPPMSIFCGLTYDTTITRVKTTGVRTFDYTFTWNWELKCPTGTPTQIAGTYTMSGIYDTPRMSSNDTASHVYTLDNVNMADTFFVWNGTYQRDGSQTSKIRNQHTFTSQLTVTTTNVHIDKDTREIISGTGTFSIVANSTNGNSRNLNGTITFNGDGTATIGVNGNTHIVHLRR